MKIGIEINNVLRDINSQMLKYYKKDIDKKFDSENLDLNTLNFIDKLGFKNKGEKYNFMYIDYPYEIFGCANPIHKHLPTMLNSFLVSITNSKYKDTEVSLFSLMENALTIQSSYFFLSKIGARIRNVLFPIHGDSLWNDFDVIVTTNKNIVKSKKFGKKVVLIKTSDNLDLVKHCDLAYDSLFDLLNDKDFLNKINNENHHFNFINKLKSFIKKFI